MLSARTICMATVPVPKRGEIWLVDFDPPSGRRSGNCGRALVISVDAIGRLPPRMIVPIPDWKTQYEHYPWFVELSASPSNGLVKRSGADSFQTKSISLTRFEKVLGT